MLNIIIVKKLAVGFYGYFASNFGKYRNTDFSLDPPNMDILNQSSQIDTQPIFDLNPAEAFAGIMLAAITADGYIAEEERHNLIVTLKRMKLFENHTQESITKIIKNLIQVAKKYDVDTLFNSAIYHLPEYLYETAFTVATDVALSDGAMPTEELYLLSKLSNALSIPQEKSDKIIEVMLIKNKG